MVATPDAWGPVVPPEELLAALGREDVVVAEVSPEREDRAHARGHVPGALDWY